MKLRTDHSSLRLRLGRSDMQALKETGKTEVKLHFPNKQSFTYALLLTAEASGARVRCLPNGLEIHLPKGDAKKWMENENLEGLYYKLPLENGLHTRLLVEKDYPCRHKTQTQSDVFSPPERK